MQNSENFKGLILLGSYIEDRHLNPNPEAFPVPVLTLIGTLDGLVLGRLRREAEVASLHESEFPNQFPVLAVDKATHAQIASGKIKIIHPNSIIFLEVRFR